MQQQFFANDRSRRSAAAQGALRAATRAVGQEGNWLVLTLPLLLLFLCAMACYLFTGILFYLLEERTVLSYAAVDTLYYSACALCALLLFSPLLLGRLRIAGLISTGQRPLAKECFYYFITPRRYLRALWLGFAYLLSLCLPVALLSLAAVLPYLLFELWLPYMLTGVAVLLLVLLYPISLALAVFLLLLAGRAFCAVPLAVANEQLGPIAALRCSLRITKGKKREPFAFLLHSAWRLLLSAVTFFVLWVVYYAGVLDIAYFGLSRTLYRDAEAA